ncbi:MAG: ABC1 kinase family protein [Burkholderiales bacterium]
MLWEALGAARDLGRVHDIAAVLIRHGFGDAVRRMGMAGALERAGRTLHWGHVEEIVRLEPHQRVRKALEELGTTFIKLGQILSTRVDLFAPEWIAEFEKLQDRATPVPFEDLRAQLEADLGAPPETVFASLDIEPLAAGSIAQVHRARLKDGTDVVLKLRRPGIRPVVEADLRLLAQLAAIIERESSEWRRFRPRALVRHLARSLERELDLETEAHHAERIAAGFVDSPDIVIPKIFWQWTGERMNAQTYIAGIPGRDIAAVETAGLDRKLLAKRGASAMMKMVLEKGFFHADPHPGNVFYLADNRIALIDFGMVGRLSERRGNELVELLYGLARRNSAQVTEILLNWSSAGDEGGAADTQPDEEALASDIEGFIDQFHGVPLARLRLGRLLGDLTALMRHHRIALPPDLAVLLKASISLEGLGRLLDPDFNMVAEATPFLERKLREGHSPESLVKRGIEGVGEVLSLATGLPGDLRRLLHAARKGAITLNVDLTHLDRISALIDRAASRLTIGIVTAALIIGSSIVMTVTETPGATWFGPRFLGVLGFVGALAGGAWLLISIWRGGRQT